MESVAASEPTVNKPFPLLPGETLTDVTERFTGSPYLRIYDLELPSEVGRVRTRVEEVPQ